MFPLSGFHHLYPHNKPNSVTCARYFTSPIIINTYHWYVFYVTFLSVLNGKIQHIDVLKRLLVMFFILGRVFYNIIRAAKYLIDVRKGR
jgi:hypothetical protein